MDADGGPPTTVTYELNRVLMYLAVVKPANEQSKEHLQRAKDYTVLAISRLCPEYLSPFDWRYLREKGIIST